MGRYECESGEVEGWIGIEGCESDAVFFLCLPVVKTLR